MADFVICAHGDEKIGIGHLTRACAIADGFAEVGLRCTLVVDAASDLADVVLKDSLIERRIVSPSSWWLLPEVSQAVVITDRLDLNAEMADRLRSRGSRALIHISESSPDYPADLRVCVDAFLPDEITTSRLSGSQFHPVRREVVRYRPTTAWSGRKIQSIIVIMGGSDPGGVTEWVSEQIARMAPSLKFTAICGPGFSPERVCRLKCRWGCRVLGNPSNLADLIIQHDAVITLGGLTSYEAACLGRPVAAPQWAHLSSVVSDLAGAGLLVNLGGVDDFAARFAEWINRPAEAAMQARHAWQRIDGQGALRLAAEISRRFF